MKFTFPVFETTQQIKLIHIELKAVKGLPELKILGLPGSYSQTLREIIKTGLKTQGFALKGLRKVIYIKDELNSAKIAFHLATMLLAELRHIFIPKKLELYCIGNLELDGKITKSIPESDLQLLMQQFPNTIFLVAADYDLLNQNLIKINTLNDLKNLNFSKLENTETLPKSEIDLFNFNNILDLNLSKYALVLSLKMQASLLLIGSSGIGKTILFRTLPALGIKLDHIHAFDSSITVTQFKNRIQKIEADSTSKTTHFLILNELADYSKSFLDYLKIFYDQLDSASLRNKYQLLMTLNPCQCGNYQSQTKLCICNPYQVKRHLSKISFPLLDRIDIVLNLNLLENSSFAWPELTHIDALRILNSQPTHLTYSLFADNLLFTMQNEFSPSNRRLFKIQQLAETIALTKNTNTVNEEDMFQAINLNSFLLNHNVIK